ncbi:hypothetical protein FQR65_LT14207 [Abscondita terminalis]|nr:hypothetical protein FQR65_LT14207 [Abscondita terminalis]
MRRRNPVIAMNGAEREGGDITAADMIRVPTEPSLIRKYFDDANVLVTGATGFIGKLVVEKLLRVCRVRKIHVLIRPKFGASSRKRFDDYFNDPVFERLKRENFQAVTKIELVDGDCTKSNMGASDRDLSALKQVSCVFHCASTSFYDDEFLTAVAVNVGGVANVLNLCRKMRDLKSVICMSTAYVHPARRDTDEVFYPVSLNGDDLLALVAILKRMAKEVAPVVIRDWCNVYTFTKAVAEDVIRTASDKLPVAVVRPSIVIGTAKEPVSGWANSFYGASGVFAGVSLGVLRTLYLEPNNHAHLVPADYVVNCMLAASLDVALKRSVNANQEVISTPKTDSIPIYNYVSSTQKPISWRSSLEMALSHMEQVPSSHQIWHRVLITTSNKYFHQLLQFVLHAIPGFFNDKTFFYERTKHFLDRFAYFTSQQWIFRNGNVEKLWGGLNAEDKKFFEFDMDYFDWDLYFRSNVRGLRVYLLKDPIETIRDGHVRQRKLKVAHYALMTLLIGTAFVFCILIVSV